jgi:hypothetical protein
MNWDAIGAIGETLGAIAVVVSLIYLAAQIRQNSRTVEGASTQSITQTIQTELRWSSDLGEEMLKMIEEPELLSKIEAFKIGEWLTAAMMARQNEYIQFKKNLVDEDIWLSNRGIIKSILSMPWCENWWNNVDKAAFTSEFVELVDSIAHESHPFDYKDYVSKIHD